MTVSTTPDTDSSSSAAAAAANPATDATDEEAVYERSKALEKKLRAAKKKIKTCEEIAAKQSDGGELNDDQLEKLDKLPGFKSDLADIQQQLAELSVGSAGGK